MDPAIKRYTLTNGLTVLLEQNKNTPVISLNVAVKVGSAWEEKHQAGLSHVLEHMVFKGTKTYGPGEIAQKVEASGGALNAFTSFDQTVYYINLASRYWQTGLHLLREMVFEALIDADELKREQEVILEELRRGQDSPSSFLSENLFGLAFQVHPYGRPIIGYENTIQAQTRQSVLDYYHHWYAPNNMVLGICGDFAWSAMEDFIAKEFGAYQKRDIELPILPPEPQLTTPRTLQKKRPIQACYMSVAFPIPQFVHPDIACLDLLSQLLGENETSRFQQEIREKTGLVSGIQSYAYSPRFPGLFILHATLPMRNFKKYWPLLQKQTNWSKEHLFPEENLERAKLAVRSSLVYEKETCEGTARKWMMFETAAGNHEYEKVYLEQIEATSLRDINRVAKKYLDWQQSSTAILVPQNEKDKITLGRSLAGPQRGKSGKKQPYEHLESSDNIHLYQLQNGFRIILRENHRLPLVSLKHACLGGLLAEKPHENGITSLTMDVLEKGSKTKSALQIGEISEAMAGHVGASSGRNSWGVSATFLAQKMDLGLDLFFDVLLNPAFDAGEFKKEQKQTLDEIHQQEDSLAHLAFLNFQSLLYKNHPYGLPVIGTQKTIRELTPKKLQNHYEKNFSPRDSVIVAVGDFVGEDLLNRMVLTLNRPFKKSAKNSLVPPKQKPPTVMQKKTVHKKKEQAHVVLGFLGTTLSNPDRYAFEVLNHVLSGQGGRLFLELRDKQSLAYTVTSSLVEGVAPGFFATYIGTEPGKVDRAIAGILQELDKIRSKKVLASEIARAQSYIVGNYERNLQKNDAIAATLLYNELYQQGLREYTDYTTKILNVTGEEVLAVAQQYLKLEAYTMVIVTP